VHNTTTSDKQHLNEQRLEILQQLEAWLELPMLVLSFMWLTLLVIEFLWGMSRQLEVAGTTIRILFILDFTLKYTLAPHKRTYLTRHGVVLWPMISNLADRAQAEVVWVTRCCIGWV
jgi:voltage-gated potassium channel